MAGDVLTEDPHLFLGSRLKRLAERMQGDVALLANEAGLPILPSQYPLLATIDRYGPQTVGALTQAMGLSQPSVTRTITRLLQAGLVEVARKDRDQRHKTVSLSQAGAAAMARSRQMLWPRIQAAVACLCAELSGSFLRQIDQIEAALSERPLGARAGAVPPALILHEFQDALAPIFRDINTQWIEAMYSLEQTDRDVLDHPRQRIIDAGGTILFVEVVGRGIVGTCALLKTGERRYELTKMGVLEAARGCKAGEFLLAAILARADAMGAECLYLLSNKKSEAAIHLYEKLGFVHDSGIMREHGARYARCDVAMRYRKPTPAPASPS